MAQVLGARSTTMAGSIWSGSWQVRRLGVDELEPLALEVLDSELVLRVSEPGRVNEADALDLVGPQRGHGRLRGAADRDVPSFAQPVPEARTLAS